MSPRGSEFTKVLIEHSVVERRHQRRGQDEIRYAIVECEESFAHFRRLHQFHREAGPHQGAQLGSLLLVGDDGEDE